MMMDENSQKPIRCLITAGPTREYLDPVRFMSNSSSGKMGYALAEAALQIGWSVDLVSGPVSLSPLKNVTMHQVVSADEMYEVCDNLFDQCDILIMVAAVTDYRPKEKRVQKIKKKGESLMVEFVLGIDIV
jgi:phosphopantothenoylcysteine decarboxylase/phosphopantothenate--cysteine ligase